MLAIIIPYYKFTFFEATLQSLADQTDKKFRVYIGDDASPENPSILLEKYENCFDFAYQRFDENLGGISLTQQWERCIALSNDEEWIMILGDDDVLGENVVENFYRNLEENQNQAINVMRFSTQIIDKDNIPISKIFLHPKIEKSTKFLIKKINRVTRSSLSEYIFKKTAINKYYFKDLPLGWYSDDLAVLQFSNFGNVFSINNSIISIRYTSDSLSGNDLNKKEKDYAKFTFFWFLYSENLNKFDSNEQLFVREKLINSFFNRLLVKNYFLIFFHSLRNFSFGLFFKINIRLIVLYKIKIRKCKIV